MVAVYSFDEVRAYINKIRSLRKGFITNFYPDQRKIEIWINYQSLYAEEYDEAVLFVKKDEGFRYLFYCATNKDVLQKSLASLPIGDKYVFDQIVDAKTDISLIDSFIASGFSIHKSLVRMSRINSCTESSNINEKYRASEEDMIVINEMLYTHFDKYSEQLPTNEELMDFLDNNHVIVCRKGNGIAGFILYDMTPATLYLRYWLVNPKFQNHGVGSELFKEYQRRGALCKRHILWVVEDNQNAIKRYEHYGYQFENMRDFILTKGID